MATQTKHTVEDILQIMSDMRGESSTNTDAVRRRAVSRAEADFARRMFWRTHLLANQTTTGDGSAQDFTIGSATYPMRPKGLTEVFVGGTDEAHRHEIVDYQAYKVHYNRNSAERMVYEWYDVANDVWKMHINPTPDNGEEITYSYFWQPPERSTTADEVVCTNPKIIALIALGDIYQGEDEDQKALLARQEAEQLISELMGMENSPAVNQIYAVGAIENSQSSRGLGTY